ncbi:MAG: putative Haloacid dehalogenase-like hydrolase protein 3 [Gemmatimonadetes bacterium]|nr:putative Haloacid dehalogenase-like hydrolase protein 3 [Gemmatimonadota bacterium]
MRVILFDAGNTLVWLDHDFILGALRDAGVHTTSDALLAAEYDAKRLMDDLVRAGNGGTDDTRARLYFAEVFRRIGMDDALFPQVAAALYARHAERNLWCAVHERTAETLAELRRRGYRLGVVSNADGRVEALLEEVALRPYFDCVLDSGVLGVEKPDPRIFLLACERMGVDPADAAYVGDLYEIDVVGARAAGLRAFLVDPLDRWTELDCDRLADLPDLLAHFPAREPGDA